MKTKRLKGKSYRDKAMAQESEVKKPQPQSTRRPQAAVLNGLKMEVVVPPVRSRFVGTPPPGLLPSKLRRLLMTTFDPLTERMEDSFKDLFFHERRRVRGLLP